MFIYEVDDEISLRLLTVKDAEPLFKIIDQSREYLRDWLPWVDHTTSVNDSLAFIQSSLQVYAGRKGLTTGIFYNNKLVGVAGFNSIDWVNRIGYIGYWLAIDYQGKGIMTRVTRALTHYAFYEYKLNRVDIRVAYENTKSQAIPKRLGFVEEGLLRQTEWLYDHFVDHIVYSLLKSEWDK
jgi:ribosomal-protein-serine acetyltransferase